MNRSTKVVAMIQARMGSTRLPGKVLKLLNGQPVLLQIIKRLQKSSRITEIVVLTSNLPQDQPIANFCQSIGINCYRGSETNVFSRYLDAIKVFQADLVIRITGDCPLISPEIVEEMIQDYPPNIDYFSNCHPIRTVPVGLDVEIFTANSFQKIAKQIKDPYDLEHVTPYYYRNPSEFKLATHHYKQLALDPKGRIALDTPKDLEIISEIYKRLAEQEHFSLADIINIYLKLSK